MNRIYPAMRRVRSQLRLDALEDRLLLSVLAGCPSLDPAVDPTTTAQAATDASTAASDTSQCCDPTVCPETGAVISSSDPALSPSPVDPAVQPVATPPTASITAGVVTPDVIRVPALDGTAWVGGALVATDIAAPVGNQGDAELSFAAAHLNSFSAGEPDLSWVDDPASPNADLATPPTLFAQADDAAARPTVPVSAYRLVPDFQPLDDASPFLVATLTTVAVPATKPEAHPAINSAVASPAEDFPADSVVGDHLPAALSESLPRTSRAAEAVPPAALDRSVGESAVTRDQENAAVDVRWQSTVQLAIPLAGFVLAVSLGPNLWPWSEEADAEQTPVDGPLRRSSR